MKVYNIFNIMFYSKVAAVSWLKYFRYRIKHYPIYQSIFQTQLIIKCISLTLILMTHVANNCVRLSEHIVKSINFSPEMLTSLSLHHCTLIKRLADNNNLTSRALFVKGLWRGTITQYPWLVKMRCILLSTKFNHSTVSTAKRLAS